MQIKKIFLVGIVVAIMLNGCGKTVQNSIIKEETTQKTGNTEQESVTEKDTNMNDFFLCHIVSSARLHMSGSVWRCLCFLSHITY